MKFLDSKWMVVVVATIVAIVWGLSFNRYHTVAQNVSLTGVVNSPINVSAYSSNAPCGTINSKVTLNGTHTWQECAQYNSDLASEFEFQYDTMVKEDHNILDFCKANGAIVEGRRIDGRVHIDVDLNTGKVETTWSPK